MVDSDTPAAIIEVLTRESPSMHAPETSTSRTESEGAHEGEHRAVIVTALMVLCNLLNDYAPFREVRPTHVALSEIDL